MTVFFFYLLPFQWQFLHKFSMPFKKCHYLPTASCSYLASFIIEAALVSVSRRDISFRILQAARAEATPSWPCGIERGAAATLHWRAFPNGDMQHYDARSMYCTMQHIKQQKVHAFQEKFALQNRLESQKWWSYWQFWWYLRIKTTCGGCPIPGSVRGQAGWGKPV